MADKNLNSAQQLAVESVKNAVVSAGAGSGKTMVLALRFLRLVEKGLAGVENILTLTFTKKAAAEMYERIYKSLLSNSDNEYVKSAINDFSKSSISTMDSFCASIVRNNSNYFGVANDFKIDPAALDKLAEKAAYDFMFANYNDISVLVLVKNWDFERILTGFLKKIALDHFNFGENINLLESLSVQKDFIKNETEVAFNNFLALCGEIEDIEDDFPNLDKFRESLSVLDEIQRNKHNLEWNSLSENLGRIVTAKPGGAVKRDTILIFKEKIDALKTEIDALKSICIFMKSLPDFQRLFSLLDDYKNSFLDLKRKSSVLGYKDLNLMAIEILKNNPGLRKYYKKKYKYIMIDEFQDNNSLQRDLLFFLAEKDEVSSTGVPDISSLDKSKLFFVGDDKQSIYRFRGGDVSVFKSLCSEIKETGGEPISLDTNYRSEADLIDFFNKIFPGIMSNCGENYEADYKPLKSRPADSNLKPGIKVFLRITEKDEDPDLLKSTDAEAFYIAEFIKDAVENKKLKIKKNDEYAYADYSDFAVLMRSTSNQIKYEKIFRRKGIPYNTQGVRTLFLEAPVNDIYSMLQLAVYPDDRIAYAAYLRSPLVNISDSALHRILVQEQQAFTEDISGLGLSDEDTGKYNHGKQLYAGLIEKAGNSDSAELVSYIWFDLGYRYFLLQNPDYHIYLEYYDYLIKLAESLMDKSPGLVPFLDFIRRNLGQYEKIDELEIEKKIDAGVNIMTIHKSKGLQFPVVILANSGNTGRNDTSEPFYYSDDFGITVNFEKDKNSNYFYFKAKELEKKKEAAELKRLLYVALTRAEYHLFISGAVKKVKSEAPDKQDTLLSLVLKSLNIDINNHDFKPDSIIQEIPEISREDYFRGKVVPEIISPEKVLALYNKAKLVNNVFVSNEFTATELNALYNSEGKTEFGKKLAGIDSDKIIKANNLESEFGTLSHYFIERHINKSGTDMIPDKYTKAFPSDSYEMILNDAGKMADNFINSGFFTSLDSINSESEVSFILKHETADREYFIKGQIDLWIELQDKIIIIDFKTDMEIKADMYYPQLTVYRKAAEEISGKKAEVFLCYLRAAEFVKFDKDLDLDDILTGR